MDEAAGGGGGGGGAKWGGTASYLPCYFIHSCLHLELCLFYFSGRFWPWHKLLLHSKCSSSQAAGSCLHPQECNSTDKVWPPETNHGAPAKQQALLPRRGKRPCKWKGESRQRECQVKGVKNMGMEHLLHRKTKPALCPTESRAVCRVNCTKVQGTW